jgi:feruloyl esterase
VTARQALAINKLWYGMTADGSVPDPAVDNGFSSISGKRKWYGVPRGTSLLPLVAEAGSSLSADMVALELQDPSIASPSFHNSKSNGIDGWKSLTYEQLAKAFDAGIALQSQFAWINTDDPDLSALKAHRVKLLQWNGVNDNLIPYQGAIAYYDRVMARMGGADEVRKFYRLFVVPGQGHGYVNSTSNAEANPPAIIPLQGQMYKLLTDWVEKSITPDNVILNSPSDVPVAKSLPMCAYPDKVTYGQGDIFAAASYVCQDPRPRID